MWLSTETEPKTSCSILVAYEDFALVRSAYFEHEDKTLYNDIDPLEECNFHNWDVWAPHDLEPNFWQLVTTVEQMIATYSRSDIDLFHHNTAIQFTERVKNEIENLKRATNQNYQGKQA
ncbi:hypothetical protein TDB9533_01261 [Thalassocella blandensis]|nr:hypothetical protein TDB9533_01261 [Thalassocella blandensis]